MTLKFYIVRTKPEQQDYLVLDAQGLHFGMTAKEARDFAFILTDLADRIDTDFYDSMGLVLNDFPVIDEENPPEPTFEDEEDGTEGLQGTS